MVDRAEWLAHHSLQPFGDALGQHLVSPAAVPRRGAERARVQAEILQPGPALGVRPAGQHVLALVQHVEHVVVHRHVRDQRVVGPQHVHARLQQPEVGTLVVQRHDLAVQDHRGTDASGQDGQLWIAAGHLLLVPRD
jgi:hypothetical protein